MRRIGPNNPGRSRVYAAKLLLLLIAGSMLAALSVLGLIALGGHPLG